ncbi:MAG: response regulator [Planctomycetes bacterium]|nr:response regulator [Planctomycetota bacterium]
MSAETGKKLILVVEDEPDEVSYLTTLFGDNGYATASASDGNAAMAKIKESRPDLITLDMSMPEKSGVKLYRELKTDPKLADIPVLVITGVTGLGGRSEDFERFLSSRKHIPPPEGFIAKPVKPDDLLDALKKLLA